MALGKRSHYFIIIIAFAIHIVALLQALLYVESNDLSTPAKLQVFGSLCASIVVIVLLPFVAQKGQVRASFLLLLQRFLSLLSRQALPEQYLFENSILICIMLETSYYILSPWSIYLAVALFSFPLLFSLPVVYPPIVLTSFGLFNWTIPVACAVAMFLIGFFFRRTAAEKSRLRSIADKQQAIISRLNKTNIAFQEYAQKIGEESTKKERNRITRDLHDSVGYILTTTGMLIDTSIKLCKRDDSGAIAALEKASKVIQDGYQDVRTSLHTLRSIEAMTPRGLNAIDKLIRTFHDVTGTEVDVHYTNAPLYCSIEIDSALYSVVQESLINAFRHGNASSIRIVLSCDNNSYRLSIQDNGTDAKELTKGIGLVGMEERVNRLGGILKYGINPVGFRVDVEIPIESEANTYATH